MPHIIYAAADPPRVGLSSDTWAVGDPVTLAGWVGVQLLQVFDTDTMTLVSMWVYDPGGAPGVQPADIPGLTIPVDQAALRQAAADSIRAFLGLELDVLWQDGIVSPVTEP